MTDVIVKTEEKINVVLAGSQGPAGPAGPSDATFTGDIGTIAYNLNDVVKALKQNGLLPP